MAGVAPDLLGFGRSPKPADFSYSVGEHLDTLAPLLEDRIVVVGHSTGAILAAALAALERQRVPPSFRWACPLFRTRPRPGHRSAGSACSPA
jgi:alpha-beta hydrolase superfamily lysophospholipase